jgi:hypothetical protein
MASLDTCPVCGFRWSAVTAAEVAPRIREAVGQFVEVLTNNEANAVVRPSVERWSILEYGSHVRDVRLAIRDRIILASIVDEPTGTPIYRDERVSIGFYRMDQPLVIANELAVMSELFVRTFHSLPPGYDQRQLIYSIITNEKVTILWAGAQAVHESEHHLSDVRENLALLST